MLVQLQYVRAVAALLVVYFHVILQLRVVDPGGSLTVFLFGKSGVDLFFVLSGFVMWVTTAGKPVTALEFYWKRIRRIVPLYWSATILAAAVAFAVPAILRSTKFDIAHVLASLFFIPWLNPADPEGRMVAPVVVPGWTLNYEMYFYLLFGGLLFLRGPLRLWLLAGVLALVSLFCALLPERSTASDFYGDLVVFEFMAGAVIGHLYTIRRLIPTYLAIGLVTVASAALLYCDYLELPAPRLFTIGIPAMVIIYGIVSIDFRRLAPLPWLRLLGDASYSIYITHIFVLAGIRMVYGHLPEGILKNEYLFVAGSIGLAAFVGVLVHRFFEAPVDRYLSGRRAPAHAAGTGGMARPAVTPLPGE